VFKEIGKKERHREGKRDLGASEAYQESQNMKVQRDMDLLPEEWFSYFGSFIMVFNPF
jgi:hypothetical protein